MRVLVFLAKGFETIEFSGFIDVMGWAIQYWMKNVFGKLSENSKHWEQKVSWYYRLKR